VFGCGNRQWKNTYQAFPGKVAESLAERGADLVAERGEGDADGDLEGDFAAWAALTLAAVVQSIGLGDSGVVIGSDFPVYATSEVAADVTKCSQVSDQTLQGVVTHMFEAHNSFFENAFFGRVLKNVELQGEDSGRSTRHIEVELPFGKRFQYMAGDHLGVIGRNPTSIVKQYCERLGYNPSQIVTVNLEETGRRHLALPGLGHPYPVSGLLAQMIELQQPATRSQLLELSRYASDPAEKTRMEMLAAPSTQGQPDLYMEEVRAHRKTILELLRECTSVQLPLGALLGLMPMMKPRFYSISSAPARLKGAVSITVSVVHGQSSSGREHLGLCSNWLAGAPFKPPREMAPLYERVGRSDLLESGLPLICVLKDTGSKFRLPASPTAPIILIGPGTGLAPMRGFLQQRQASAERGPCVLFFGCRSDTDYIYHDDLKAFLADGTLSQLHVAFSRKVGVAKTYVQDLVRKQAEELWPLIAQGGHIYVCGDAGAMAPAVKEAFIAMAATQGSMPMEEAYTYVKGMEDGHRYCEDVWAGS